MENVNPVRILFVEDLPSDAALAEREIRKSGLDFSSLRVDTKDAFLKALEDFRPDIIVSDYSMPTFDGMQALNLSLTNIPWIPFILLTGSMNEETAVACMKAGASDYVIKERMSRLPFAVKEALKQKKMRAVKHEAERALRESEEQYRVLVDNANEAIIVVQDGLIKFVNHNALELTGYSNLDLSTRPFTDFIHPDDRTMVGENYTKRVKGLSVPPRYSFRVVTQQGDVRWVETGAAMVEWKGKPATLNFLTDITKRRDAEAALIEETTRRRILFEQSPDGIVLIDPETAKIIEFNTAAHRQLGYSREEFAKLSISDVEVIETVEDTRATIARVMHDRRADFETLHRTKDGELRNVSVTAQYIDVMGHPIYQCFWRDITDRKRAEESRLMLTTALESTANGVVITGLDGKIVWSNPAFTAMTGYTRTEVVGQNPSFLKSGKQDGPFYKDLWETINAGRVWKGELVNKRKDGSLYTEEMTITPVRNQDDKVNHFVALKQDITERKKAEQAVQDSERRFRAIFDQAPIAMALLDLEGHPTISNLPLSKMVGYSADELSNMKFTDFTYAEDADKDLKQFVDLVAGKISKYSMEKRYVHKDGYLVWANLFVTILRNDDGSPQAIIGMVEDITQRKKAEEKIALLAHTLKSISECVSITDLDDMVLFVNQAFCTTYGYGEQELLGKNISVVRSSSNAPPNAPGINSATLKGGWSGELLNLKKDGTEFPVSLSTSLVRDDAGQPIALVGVATDITDRKHAENDLRLSEERFRLVWDKSADGMRLIDEDGRILDANDAYCRLSRLPREKLVGQIFSKVYREGGPDADIRIYQNRFNSRQIVPHFQAPVTLWDGTVLELDISNSFIETGSEERMVLSIFRDITDWKLSEQHLEKERNLLRTIIDAIPDEISVKDTERRFILVNKGTMKALKRSSAEDIIGKRDEDLIPEKFALQSKAEEEPVLASGRPSINRLGNPKINSATGEIERAILISKIPLKDSSGTIVGLVGINRDITEVQRAYALLEKERTLLLTLIDSIPDEICMKDAAHRFIVANQGVVKALGAHSMEDLLGKTDRDYLSPELAQLHFDEEDAVLESGRSIINLERTSVDPMTGEIQKCQLTTKVPVSDKSGRKIGILVINRFITERKKAEDSLRASEEKFRALFEESLDTVYISSPEGKMLDINGAGLVMFGYSSKMDLLKIDVTTGYVDSAKRADFKRQLEDQGFVRDLEQQFRRRDGEILTVLETATAVRNKSGAIVMYRGIIRDVTKQRLLEQQFIQAQKMESIGTLAGGVAHDFNNILGIILGNLALLERTRKDEAQFEDSILSINKAVERGASLVRQILTFARKADVQFEPVSVNSTVRELVKMLEETFPKTMAIRVHLDKSIPVISMDPSQLHQTLLNLCVNARDAMQGKGTLSITSQLVIGGDVASRFPKANAGHYAKVSVADTGVGMDEAIKGHIFDPFFTTKEKGKGTGLGLAVVYGVMQAHNGFVDVDSKPGAGTTFHLYFPVPDGILAIVKKGGDTKEGLPGGTETILVVEDEDVLRDILVKLLEMHGYKVIQATDGEEAVLRFGEHANEIDLVLSDMGLPKRGGWEAFKMMRQKAPKVRCLLASGYIEPGQKSEALKSGVRGFIQKPYKMEDVLNAVRKTLDAKK